MNAAELEGWPGVLVGEPIVFPVGPPSDQPPLVCTIIEITATTMTIAAPQQHGRDDEV